MLVRVKDTPKISDVRERYRAVVIVDVRLLIHSILGCGPRNRQGKRDIFEIDRAIGIVCVVDGGISRV
jgi:hypothetical protein